MTVFLWIRVTFGLTQQKLALDNVFEEGKKATEKIKTSLVFENKMKSGYQCEKPLV